MSTKRKIYKNDLFFNHGRLCTKQELQSTTNSNLRMTPYAQPSKMVFS